MTSFHDFLHQRIEAGGFSTEDVLASIVPLMQQVIATHESGRVAPLDGLTALHVENGVIWYAKSNEVAAQNHLWKIRRLLKPQSRGVDVVGEYRVTQDVSDVITTVSDLRIASDDTESKDSTAFWVPGFRCWEHTVGHHDPLTDVFSLGLVLASMACGLDLAQPDDHDEFVKHRTNLFAVNPDLHPVFASAITTMTETDRSDRPGQLPALLNTLKNYRDQTVDFETDLVREHPAMADDHASRRQVILRKLQERLFEITRRNKLLHFRPTMQTVNLTHSSIPLMFDFRNIRDDQVLTWNADFRKDVLKLKEVSLNKYLNFREAVYLPGTLARLRAEARRDETEYGFAQLRLIVCFLKWADLKANPPEQYDSPLLLLPVRLGIRKGIHDRYTLTASESSAEVNPVIRHLFRQLYDIDLPDRVELAGTGIDEFFAMMAERIAASGASVNLKKIDRPRLELIHTKAVRRLDQFRRRARLSGRGIRQFMELDYSYESVNYHPLGIRIFEEFISPVQTHLDSIVSSEPPRPWYMVEPNENDDLATTVTAEKQFYNLKEKADDNPYNWEFNLCNVTLANLKYRRMSLVRDYESLVTDNTDNKAFETAFAVTPPSPPVEAAPLDFSERYQVVPCDPTQSQAVGNARAGDSYIIQGPPGTGKSQTITNLIADFVIRGKRVLFVCEKRAAIDVVFHRLKQQQLDDLCCLIHDSQADKKQFVMDLKATSETYQAEIGEPADRHRAERDELMTRMQESMNPLERFDRSMRSSVDSTDMPLRSLLSQLIRVTAHAPDLVPAEWERVPSWGDWHRSQQDLREFASRLRHVQASDILSEHPLRLLSPKLVDAERPVAVVDQCLSEASKLLEQTQELLQRIGLPAELVSSLNHLEQASNYANHAVPLSRNDGLTLLDSQSELAKDYEKHLRKLSRTDKAIRKAQHHTAHWKEKLSSEDTRNALEQAQQMESSMFAIARPAWWRLRSVLHRAYDFSAHAVKPSWVTILKQLDSEHEAYAKRYDVVSDIAENFQIHVDFDVFQQQLETLRSCIADLPESLSGLHALVLSRDDSKAVVQNLCRIGHLIPDLTRVLNRFLGDFEDRSVDELQQELTRIESAVDDLPDYLHCLKPLQPMPKELSSALRTLSLSLQQLEAACAERTLRDVCRENRELETFDAEARQRLLEQLKELNDKWATANGRVIREFVRQRYLDGLAVTTQPATVLTPEQKSLKKIYNKGRRELEHEFGKSMRYKSIRELAAGESGVVVRDLKPVWLMSPLSVSDTLPLEDIGFDVVIFDEASQITLEEAVPAVFRAEQIIVVGDEMQLPPTSFFSTHRTDEDDELMFEEDGETVEYDLNSSSFLNQAARNLPSRMLGWHYRSRSESLISFSNHAFYHGRLLTVPEETLPSGEQQAIIVSAADDGDAMAEQLLERAVSFHFIANGTYVKRRNRSEAEYIAYLVRGILKDKRRRSIGIVAFSEAQQEEIETALQRLAQDDPDFGEHLEAEREREDDGQFNGLLVKNLENIQGDERDVIIMSVCYGPNPDGRIRMNFGPINQAGGEKRLNVAFSRARHHMALVSSMRSTAITNEYNEGAACLKNYLRYAEAASLGQQDSVSAILKSLSGRTDRSLTEDEPQDEVVRQLSEILTNDGWQVKQNVGQSSFRCDLAVYRDGDLTYRLAILVDTAQWYAQTDLLERELLRPELLKAFGWKVMAVRARDWYFDQNRMLAELEEALR